MFAKFELKYGRGRCDRGILKGSFHLVGNTTSLFPLCLIFFLSQSAVHQTRTACRSGEEEERKSHTERREACEKRCELCGGDCPRKKVINLEIFRMSRAYCTATPSKCRVYRIDKSSLPNQLSIVTRSNGVQSFPGI